MSRQNNYERTEHSDSLYFLENYLKYRYAVSQNEWSTPSIKYYGMRG